jgi:hypothetical protein
MKKIFFGLIAFILTLQVAGAQFVPPKFPLSEDADFGDYNLDNGNSIYLNEKANANADVAGDGQIWVKTATPNVLYYTDDAGNDIDISGGVSGAATRALDNLASVAINTSLFSDTAATDSLGSEALYWLKLFVGSDISFEGSTDDDYQTTLTATDTTSSDKTITLPDATGTVMLNVVEDTTPQLGGDLDLNSKNLDFPTTANISDVLDEDDMASNSATKLATQQSIKSYVDSTVNVEVDYFFNNTASDIGGIYYDMTNDDLGGGESNIATAGLSASTDDQALNNYASDNTGGIGILTIPSGVFSVHFHAERTAGTSSVNIYSEIYKRASGGAETLLTTTEISDAVTSKAAFEIHGSTASDTDMLVTDRIVIKFYANVGAGSGATVAIYQEGTTTSRLTIPSTSEILSEIFIRQDGTKAWTGNQSLGTNDLTSGGDIFATDAAGYTLQNEAATTTNPTLIPNRAEEDTGIGWASDVLHFVGGGSTMGNVSITALSAVGDVSVGDDLLIPSASNVINWVSGDITLTHSAGKLTWGGDGTVEIDFNNHEMTNVDIDSGAMDGVTIGGGTPAAGTFTAVTIDNSIYDADGVTWGSATADSGPLTLIQGAQAGDPQVILDLTADANGDFSITTDTGDIVIGAGGPSLTVDVTGNSGTAFMEVIDDNNAGFLAVGRTTATDGSRLSITDGGGDNHAGELVLYADDGNGNYFWTNTADVFRAGNSAPADDDAGGYAIMDLTNGTIGASAQQGTFDDVTLADDLLLADGAVVGITGNEILTFAAAGTITVGGATLVTSGNIELGHATDTTLSRSAAGVLAVEGVVIPSISSTNTLTNKRITARVLTFVSDATPDVNSDSYDAVTITAQAAAITDVNVTGTPTNFQKLVFRILDDGTGRAITWGSDFQAMGVDLPTTTTANKVLTVGFIYDTVDSKWGCVAVADEE